MPKFSIIIPVYNVAPYIGDCLSSLISQSFDDWEAICVDDGSLDGAGAIIDDFAAKDKRFRVVHKKNEGVAIARNLAVGLAHGEWVLFLDGDDVLGVDALRTIVDVSKAYPKQDYIRFSFTEFTNKFEQDLNSDIKIVDVRDFVPWDTLYAYMTEFAFKRNRILGISASSFRRGQDRTFIVQVILFRMESYAQTNSKIYGYRTRIGSSIHTKASVPVMKDELGHRIVILQYIDSCNKKVVYARSGWLEEFCIYGYIANSEFKNRYCGEEVRDLLGYYYEVLPKLRNVQGFSRTGKVVLYMYQYIRLRCFRRLVCVTIPLFRHYVVMIVENPRLAMRKIVARLGGKKTI